MKTIRGAFKSLTIWVNGVLLAIFPFASDIMAGLQENLPQLAQYLPENIFKTLGAIVVVANILLRVKTNTSLKDKGDV